MGTFSGTFGNTFGNTFGDGVAPALAIGDMVNITTRQVYTDLLDASAVTSDPEAVTFAEGLTVNSEVDDYDWSPLSVVTYHSSDWTQSIPVTLISDTFGISANHNFPNVAGDKCWFRSQAGDAYVATVADTTTLTNSGATLVRFSSDPSTALARTPIVNDGSLQRYVAATGKFWQFYQTLSIRLRQCSGFQYGVLSAVNGGYCDIFTHDDGGWSQGDITTGSGRPAVVPLNDGRLILLGTAEFGASPNGNDRVSLDKAQIITALAAYGEEATFMDIPGYPGVRHTFRDGFRDGIRRGIRQTIGAN